MRTLCLNLQKQEKPSVAENFLVFSPRVHFRDPGLVFVDVGSTAHLFGGEQALMTEALALTKDFYPDATASISDTPFAAQVFSNYYSEYIAPPAHEIDELRPMPLKALSHLEGLIAWRSQREIEDLIQFFQILGLNCVGEIKDFEVESFRERWKNTGALLWKRLHGLDKQVISPLEPSVFLEDYIYLDFPISLTSFLLHCLEKSFRKLFARLQGRCEFAQKVQIHLQCEYSNQCHIIELAPAHPSRDLDTYMKLLENKLESVNLENPIKEIEISIVSCNEKVQQLDFWQPRASDDDKLKKLVNVLDQATLTTGFLKLGDSLMPEDSWSVAAEHEDYTSIEDTVAVDGLAYQLKPAYSKNIHHAPRPSLVLKEPKPLSDFEFRCLQLLSPYPIERIENDWWDQSRGRDYYIALSRQGRCLWVFHDLIEDEYFLHGFFD
jgi:protein ImuB